MHPFKHFYLTNCHHLKLLLLDKIFYRLPNSFFGLFLVFWFLPATLYGQNSSISWIENEQQLKNLFQEHTIIGEFTNNPGRQWIEYYQTDGQSTYFWDDCYFKGIWWIRLENPKACFSYFDNQEISGLRTSCFDIGLTDNGQIIFADRTLSELLSENNETVVLLTYSLVVENGNSRHLPTGAEMTETTICNKPISWLQ